MNARPSARRVVALVSAILLILVARLIAQDAHFHNAPAETTRQKNPYAGQSEAVAEGSKLFATNCASCHGPNGQGTGNEVIRIPMHQSGRASGAYEDFVTGFVVDNGHVWGRPVGVTVAPDGSLLVTDDGSNSIWRVIYIGKQ